MCSDRLRVIEGEFVAPEREAAFQSARLPETRRHARLTLFVAAFVYTLIIVSDGLYGNREAFWDTLPLRLAIIAMSIGSFVAARHVATFSRLQDILLAWSVVTTAAVAVLCTLRPAIAPFVTLILPALYLCVLPMRFWRTVISALACAATLLSLHSVQSTLAALVIPLIHLGRSLGLAVTAEGVETSEQAQFLTEKGCDHAQGYLYAKPMAQSRVSWFLQNRPDLLGRAGTEKDALLTA